MIIQAKVIKNKKWNEGTLTVQIDETYRHPLYGKILHRRRKFLVNNPNKSFIDLNKIILVKECAPVSKKKRHEVVFEVK